MSEVFRVKKTKDFTVMSNRHLRDKRLSLKGKGLLSLILSLPDNWDYSIKGFTKLVPDGVDSVRTALKELTSCGYIEVSRKRDSKGRLSVSEYTIYEEPKQDKPDTENPVLDKPDKAKPVMEKPSQLSKKEINTEILNKDVINNQSINQNENDEIENRKIYRFIIKSNIEYDILLEQGYDKERLEEIVEIMVDCTCSSSKTIVIGTEEFPKEVVKSRMLKLNSSHIEYIFYSMKQNTTKVKNIKAYMRSVIYNSVLTIGNFYATEVNHDLYGAD